MRAAVLIPALAAVLTRHGWIAPSVLAASLIVAGACVAVFRSQRSIGIEIGAHDGRTIFVSWKPGGKGSSATKEHAERAVNRIIDARVAIYTPEERARSAEMFAQLVDVFRELKKSMGDD